MDYTDTTLPTSSAPAMSPIWGLVWLVLVVAVIVALWRMFVKAGRPGWASIVPFYNSYVLVKMAGRPGWWFLLLFVPFVNLIVLLVLSLDLAKAFGKSPVFGVVGLWLFSVVGYLILGFDKSKYTLPVNGDGAAPAAPATPAPQA